MAYMGLGGEGSVRAWPKRSNPLLACAGRTIIFHSRIAPEYLPTMNSTVSFDSTPSTSRLTANLPGLMNQAR